MDKKLLFLLSLLLAIIFLFLTARPLFNQQDKGLVNRFAFNKQVPAWETWANTKIGYRLSYPGDWLMDEWDMEEAANLKNIPDGSIFYQGKFFGESGHFEILVWENKTRAGVRTWLSWFRREDLTLDRIPEKENFTILGQPAILYRQLTTARGKSVLYIFFGREDKIYELNFEGEKLLGVEVGDSSQQVNAVYDKILKNFVFVVE